MSDPNLLASALFPCRYREENVRLTDEYKRITEQFKDLQSKFRHFELVDTRKYKEVGGGECLRVLGAGAKGKCARVPPCGKASTICVLGGCTCTGRGASADQCLF